MRKLRNPARGTVPRVGQSPRGSPRPSCDRQSRHKPPRRCATRHSPATAPGSRAINTRVPPPRSRSVGADPAAPAAHPRSGSPHAAAQPPRSLGLTATDRTPAGRVRNDCEEAGQTAEGSRRLRSGRPQPATAPRPLLPAGSPRARPRR